MTGTSGFWHIQHNVIQTPAYTIPSQLHIQASLDLFEGLKVLKDFLALEAVRILDSCVSAF